MKSLGDAIKLRNRMIQQLEEAETECGAPDRDHLHDVRRRGRRIRRRRDDRRHERLRPPGAEVLPAHPDQEKIRMVLVHPGEVILPELSEKLGRYAAGEARRSRRRDPGEDEGRGRHRAGRDALGRDRDRRGDDHLDGGHAAEPADEDAPVQAREGQGLRRRVPAGPGVPGRLGARRLRPRARIRRGPAASIRRPRSTRSGRARSSRRTSSRSSAERPSGRSRSGRSASSPRSAAAREWPRSSASISRASWPGGCGGRST